MAGMVYVDGAWHEGNVPILGPLDHATWMASVAFDGARCFGGLTPDLDRHCERLVHSAKGLLLQPDISAEEITDLCRIGAKRFPQSTELYIRPMFYATSGFVLPAPESTRFAIAVHELPMPSEKGMGVCWSSYRRPSRDAAPTDTKSSCLYPNMQRALHEAMTRGFDNCITLDPSGNVAELATANLWIAKDGVALTPVCNGTFLNGITRQRVMALLRQDGVEVIEATLTKQDVFEADELFTTGNYGKVLPITRIEDRDLQLGRIYRRARELYFAYAEECRI